MEAVHGALRGSGGYVTIANPEASNWAYRTSEVASIESSSAGEIPAYTIEDLLARSNASRIDILKLDIEGAEEEVLASSEGWIDCVQLMMVEFHDEPGSSSDRDRFQEGNGRISSQLGTWGNRRRCSPRRWAGCALSAAT